MSEDTALDELPPSKVMITDVAQLLGIAATVIGHPALTPDSLKGAQGQVKAFIADKQELQDPQILVPLDQILKYGTAAQVSAAYIPPPFDLKDYVTNGSVSEIAES